MDRCVRARQIRESYGQVARRLVLYGDYGAINVVGRVLSVLFDLGTVYLVYLLGLRVYGRWVGLIGAALVGV